MLKRKKKPQPQAKAHCRECNAWRGAGTVCVPSRGSMEDESWPDSPIDVLFVVEAPTSKDDRIARILSSQAGKLLDVFAKQYLQGRSYVVTSSVRCYLGVKSNNEPVKPWVGSKDNPGPMKACRQYLEEEIEHLRPQLIVPLGKLAISMVLGLPSSKISTSKLTARPMPTQWRKEGTPIRGECFAMNHPGWVIRAGTIEAGDSAAMSIWERQWEALLRHLEGKGDERPGKYAYWDIELKHKPDTTGLPMSFDFETTGLDPWNDDFRMVGTCRGIAQALVLKLDDKTNHKYMAKMLEEKHDFIVHNFTMEMLWSKVNFGLYPQGLIYDTKILNFLIDENMSKRLEDLTDVYLPQYAGFKKASESIGILEADDSILAERCAYDVITTMALKDIFWEKLTLKQQKLYRDIIEPGMRTIVNMIDRGWQVDVDKLHSLRDAAVSRLTEIYTEMISIPEVARFEKYVQSSRPGVKPKTLPLNLNSGKEMPDLLKWLKLDDGSVERQPNDPKRMRIAQDCLEPLKGKHPVVDLLLEYKSTRHTLSQFLTGFISKLDDDGVLHPPYNWGGKVVDGDAAGTVTGRLSCSKPNLMNLPRPGQEKNRFMGAVRSCIISRWKGGQILGADYSQLELRIMAMLSNEEGLLQIFKDGGDPHQLTADKMGVDKYKGKTLNFAAAYGASKFRVAQLLGCSEDEGQQMLIAFWESYPNLHEYFQDLRGRAYIDGYLENPFGMRVHCPEVKSGDGHAARRVGNWPIQSTGAMLCYDAMQLLDRTLMERESKTLLFGQLHDAVYVDTHPKDDAELVTEVIQDSMVARMYKRHRWLNVALEVDSKLTPTMGE